MVAPLLFVLLLLMPAYDIGLFRALFTERIAALSSRSTTDTDGTLTALSEVTLPHLRDVRPDVLAALPPKQRAIHILDVFRRQLAEPSDDIRLTEPDFLKMLLRDNPISDLGARVASALVTSGCAGERNPTIPNVVSAVDEAVRQGRPLECIASVCLTSSPVIEQVKINVRTDRASPPCSLDAFATDFEEQGWNRLKRIFQTVPYRVHLTLLLDDIDLYTIEGAGTWADADSRVRLAREIDKIHAEVVKRAQLFFGARSVSVGRWSTYVPEDRFNHALHVAEDMGRWINPALLSSSFDVYKMRGYRMIQHSAAIPEQLMDRCILEDVTRRAAQYRLQADIVRSFQGIRLWVEPMPMRTWPLELSNYDGAGFAPTLFLV